MSITNLLSAIGRCDSFQVKEIITQYPHLVNVMTPCGHSPLYIALTNCVELTRSNGHRFGDNDPMNYTHLILECYQIVDSLLDAGAIVPPEFSSSKIVKKYEKKHKMSLDR